MIKCSKANYRYFGMQNQQAIHTIQSEKTPSRARESEKKDSEQNWKQPQVKWRQTDLSHSITNTQHPQYTIFYVLRLVMSIVEWNDEDVRVDRDEMKWNVHLPHSLSVSSHSQLYLSSVYCSCVLVIHKMSPLNCHDLDIFTERKKNINVRSIKAWFSFTWQRTVNRSTFRFCEPH